MTTIAHPCHIEKGNKLFLSLQNILPQQANLHIKTKLASVISSELGKSEGEFLLVQIVKSLGKITAAVSFTLTPKIWFIW